jgi:predicted peroxiredoxin
MKATCVCVLTCLVALAMPLSAALADDAAAARDGVFIHVTHGQDDPHRVLMALHMADIMADDHDVLVYFDIQGVNVVLKNAQDLSFAHFKPSGPQLAELRRKGVILMACPGCLKAAGKTAEDLAPGVKTADKGAFFSFTKGRILSLDY